MGPRPDRREPPDSGRRDRVRPLDKRLPGKVGEPAPRAATGAGATYRDPNGLGIRMAWGSGWPSVRVNEAEVADLYRRSEQSVKVVVRPNDRHARGAAATPQQSKDRPVQVLGDRTREGRH